MIDPMLVAILVAIGAPLAATAALSVRLLLSADRPSERLIAGMMNVGLATSLLGAIAAMALLLSGHPTGEVELGPWVKVGSYVVPAVFLVDAFACVFALLAAALTALMARFSRTYLHKEPGFGRYFVLLGMFATGVQLVAFAGALDLMFAGWELIGVSSVLFIGFFSERDEPVRSSLRTFATYRLCDVGFFLAIVATHETLGSTRLSVLSQSSTLAPITATAIALLFVIAALGKSAQLPFSTWLPRAMEGPTPSSALFYGGISIHAGLYLLLRVHPLLDVAPIAEATGVVVGLATATYATLIARVQTDAKGALAFSTMAQTGLILAEISAGFTTLALIHLVGHAMLRVGQYLRTPNTIHDAHERGHVPHHPPIWDRFLSPAGRARLHAGAVHRFRLDDTIDAAMAPFIALTGMLDRIDRRVRATLSLDPQEPPC